MAVLNPKNYHTLFHRNMMALMIFNQPTRRLTDCFKERMFSCPNQEGFVQVSYFLINIIYPGTKAFKSCWPILDRSQERAFRAALIVLIRGLNDDFGDIYPISFVVPTRLMSPGGNRFMKIMWELSILALGVHTKRESRDSDCFFLQKPPMTAPQHLRNKAELICQAQTKANLKECESILADLEERMNNYKELKGSMLDRMFARDKKMRETESYAVKLFKESGLEVALVSKLMDLKNGEGILELEARVKQKEIALAEMLQHCQDTSSLARETKYILEAAIKQEHNSHKILLDVSCIPGSETKSGATENVRTANADDPLVLFLKYIRGLHDRLKALKVVIEEANVNELIDKWKSIRGKKEVVEAELSKMEEVLKQKLLKFDENNSGEDSVVSEMDSIGSSLAETNLACSSTPENKHYLQYPAARLEKSLSATPYQPTSTQDFFSEKLMEAMKETSDKKENIFLQEASTLHTTGTPIDEILDRFRRIVAAMNRSPAE